MSLLFALALALLPSASFGAVDDERVRAFQQRGFVRLNGLVDAILPELRAAVFAAFDAKERDWLSAGFEK